MEQLAGTPVSDDGAPDTGEYTNPAHDVRMDGVYFCRANPQMPFHLKLESGEYSYCFMVREGRMTYRTDFPVPITLDLGPGDIVAVSGLTPHSFKTPGCDSADPTGCFEQVPLGSANDVDASPSSRADLIIGVVRHETLALSTMVAGPIHLGATSAPDCARRIWKAAELLLEEFRGEGQSFNQPIIVRRIAEIIAINMTRSRLMLRDTGEIPFSTMPTSINVLRALRAFLDEPYRDWTVSELAQIAGRSRTKFSEEFRLVTGNTPIQTIGRIRLMMIARRFLAEKMSVEEAADICGYSSAAAFVRAFQREFGVTPARWRKQQRV